MTRMTRTEREVIDRVDDVVKFIGTLTPSNPADTTAIFRNAGYAAPLAEHASLAIGAMRGNDYENADWYLTRAEEAMRAYDNGGPCPIRPKVGGFR